MNRKTQIAMLASALLLTITAGYLWQGGFLARIAMKYVDHPEKITIGTGINEMSGLLFVAEHQGYDKEHGLEITTKTYESGRSAVRDLRAELLDLACCAEFVLVSEIFAGAANLRCFSALSSGGLHELVTRRDRGISRKEDLRGKTIGVPLGTSAEFFLGIFLTFNNIALKEVRIVDVNPDRLADVLIAGKVDAVLAWEPLTYDIVKTIGDNAITFPVKGGQDYYWLLVGREEVINKKGAALDKLLRALAQAADFVKERPQAAREIVAQGLKIPLPDLQTGRFHMRYELSLDQALLLAMEDQARWMMRNKLTSQTTLPNYLDYLHAEPLAKVDPQAVRLIVPKAGMKNVPGNSEKAKVN